MKGIPNKNYYLSATLRRPFDRRAARAYSEHIKNKLLEGRMSEELLRDLPRTLPAFVRRFGTDAQCRAYLVRALWPEGFRCSGCGHRAAWSHKRRLIEECRACGKQHSILAGTMFEQTKTGLSRWFLAIYLVTSSKGGISAMELQRQMGFGSYGTALRRLLAPFPSGDRLLTVDGHGCTRSAAP
jgi:hypothetical protein